LLHNVVFFGFRCISVTFARGVCHRLTTGWLVRGASETIENALAGYSVIKEVRLVFYAPADAWIFLENHRFTPG